MIVHIFLLLFVWTGLGAMFFAAFSMYYCDHTIRRHKVGVCILVAGPFIWSLTFIMFLLKIFHKWITK